MLKVICIRHGETTGDLEDRYGGCYDDALSPEGERQAAGLADELATAGISKVYCSTLQRAMQTAGCLAEKAGYPVHAVDGLRERDQYGVLTGMTKAEAKEIYPAMVEAVNNYRQTIEGAESYDAFSARVQDAFKTIVQAGEGAIAVVWHGGGMRVLFRDILQAGELEHIGDCAWVELTYEDNKCAIGRMTRLKRVG